MMEARYKYKDYEEACRFLKEKNGGFEPEVVMVLGSGLAAMADMIEDPVTVGYEEIPGWGESTLDPGYKGSIVFGKLCERRIACMRVRLHCYEGFTMEEAGFPMRVLKLMGAGSLIVTNAAGCINAAWGVGELMLIKDHIRLFGFGPLRGANIEEFGPRFNDMTEVYDASYRKTALGAAEENGIKLHEGVYIYFPGPSFETPAEVRAARILGADAVGMSTVPEVTVAAHCGYRIMGITVLTNMAAGVTGEKLDDCDVHTAAAKAWDDLGTIIRDCLKDM